MKTTYIVEYRDMNYLNGDPDHHIYSCVLKKEFDDYRLAREFYEQVTEKDYDAKLYIFNKGSLFMGEWKSINECLPDINKKVLIYCPTYKKYGQDMFVACLCDWEKDICDEWHLLSENYTHEVITFPLYDATHWMPLPEIPK